MPNSNDKRSYDIPASEQAQDNFNSVASRLEALIGERDQAVAAAMAEFSADGVSEEYRGKEQEWKRAADEVREIIRVLRGAMGSNDGTAGDALARAKAKVGAI